MPRAKPIRIAVLVSGRGATLQNLATVAGRGFVIACVVCSRDGVAAIDRAARLGIPCDVVPRSRYASVAAFSRAVFAQLKGQHIDLVCLAGWLSLLNIPPAYRNRVMNIHPALLPSFGGKGMYGRAVHAAVLDHGCKISGCTVHFVDAHYDQGPIILQQTCPVLDGDTPESLAHRVFECEKTAYPHAIKLFANKQLQVSGRRVRVLQKRRQTH